MVAKLKPYQYGVALNLSDCFAPLGGYSLAKRFTFPGGEQHITLPELPYVDSVLLTVRFTNADDLMNTFLAADALHREGYRVGLFAPYIPYARQDRVSVKGEPLSIAVLADLLNSCEFNDVYGLDAHSDVAPALIRNYHPLDWLKFAKAACSEIEGGRDMSTLVGGVPVLIAPDAGAAKKVAALARARHCDMVQGRKYRDPNSGQVSISVDVPSYYKHAIVVDDICDGGATFMDLPSQVKCKVHLVVTHGIFSKGLKPLFDAGYESIHTTDSWGGSIPGRQNFYVHEVPVE